MSNKIVLEQKEPIKLCLDDADDEQILKRRFLKKNMHVSKKWGLFSSEWTIDLGPGGRDIYGVNREEISVCCYGRWVNQSSWTAR
jgi:hypothetical protein